ncbi:hypothetical protein evm_003648 [Chilo suppressalis]|nr:hypothetical protein evm_003648 [Chilo suppressalis]
MATEVTDEAVNEIKDDIITENLYPHISSETFTKEVCQEQDLETTSSYTLASQSQFSNDVDRWIRGSSIQSTGVQNSRTVLTQRSTLAATASMGMSSVWYVLAMILPIFSMNINCTQWRYNPSTVLNTAELLFAHVSAVCQSIRNRLRRLARDQVAREMFATALDVVLIVYAVGFLVISLYQASIIG